MMPAKIQNTLWKAIFYTGGNDRIIFPYVKHVFFGELFCFCAFFRTRDMKNIGWERGKHGISRESAGRRTEEYGRATTRKSEIGAVPETLARIFTGATIRIMCAARGLVHRAFLAFVYPAANVNPAACHNKRYPVRLEHLQQSWWRMKTDSRKRLDSVLREEDESSVLLRYIPASDKANESALQFLHSIT